MELRISCVSYLTEEKDKSWISFNKKEKEKVLHLKDVSMTLKPGSVSTFLGTGHGYKRLLECIALRQTAGFMSGSIHYDNSTRKSGSFRDVVFVSETGGAHFECLTVFDYLFYAAKLRISHGNIECRERARVATKLVGIEGGAKIRSLNHTGLRLMTIAGELVGMPTLLCIMNPLASLDAAGSIEVMHALYKASKRQSSPTTIVYCVDGLNNDMMRYIDNVAIFRGVKLIQNINLRAVDDSILTPVENLITDISLQLTQQEPNDDIESVSSRFTKHVSSMVNTRAVIAEVLSTVQTEDAVTKLSMDLTDLLCSITRNPTAATDNQNSNQHSLARTMTPISYGGSAVYDEDDDLYLGAMHQRTPSILERTETDQDGWSSINASPGTSSPMNQGRWGRFGPGNAKAGAVNDSLIPPSESRSKFVSASRRRGDLGVALRPLKPIWKEISILIARSCKYHWKNSTMIRMGVFRYLFIGFIVGIFGYMDGGNNKIDNTDLVSDPSNGLVNSSAYNVTSALFIMVTMSVVGSSFAVPYMHSNIRLLKLEVAAGLHRTVSGWFSIVAVEIPAFIVASFCMAGIVHAFLNIDCPAAAYYGTVVLVMLSGYSLAASCAAWCATAQSASFWFGVWSMICIVFSGFLQPIPDLPGMWPWATTISFTRWSFEALMASVFQRLSEGGDYLAQYEFNNASTLFCMLWLAVWLTSLQVVVITGLLPPADKLIIIDSESDHIKRFDVGELDKSDTLTENPPPSPSKVSAADFEDPSLTSTTNSYSARMDPQLTLVNNSNVVVKDPADRFTVVPLKPAAQVSISFQKLRYELKDPRNTDGTDYVLQNVSGAVEPGGSLCILDGNSFGAGSTLLHVLAGRAPAMGKISGIVKVNGAKLRRGMSYINAGFVNHGDVSLAPISVRDFIRYSALLRRTDQKTCPAFMSCFRKCFRKCCRGHAEDYHSLDSTDLIGKTGDVEERVDEAMKIMGLDEVAKVVVENSQGRCNLTPAQLRCLTIAVELVNRPGLIFLDDPVRGLDWRDADVVAAGIQCLAQGGRTVITSLQSPSYRVHKTFTDTLLVGSGLMLYFGTTNRAVTYFENIGFEKSPDQNPLQYIMKIGGDMGVMKKTAGGRRAAALSPEDLADLCRSLTKISAGKSKSSGRSAKSIAPDEDDDDFDFEGRVKGQDISAEDEPRSSTSSTSSGVGSAKRKSQKRGGSNEASNVISVRPVPVSIGPLTRVLMARGFRQAFRDRMDMLLFALRYLFAGTLIGSVFWQLSDGEYEQRVSLFALVFFYINLTIGDQLRGIHERKKTFIRERSTGASHFAAYWIADSAPGLWLNLVGCFLFTVPLYCLAGLRSGWDHFGYFFGLLFLSSYCNLGLAYVLSFFCRSERESQMIFNGVLIPLQLVMSGYLFLVPTMASWYKWGTYICPLSYFLAGCFANEFDGNDAALGTNTYSSISDFYDFNSTSIGAVIALVIIGLVNNVCWLLLMKLFDMSAKGDMFKRVVEARLKAKLIVEAGIRVVQSAQPRKNQSVSTFSYARAEEDAYIELESGTRSPIHQSSSLYSAFPPSASPGSAVGVGLGSTAAATVSVSGSGVTSYSTQTDYRPASIGRSTSGLGSLTPPALNSPTNSVDRGSFSTSPVAGGSTISPFLSRLPGVGSSTGVSTSAPTWAKSAFGRPSDAEPLTPNVEGELEI